MTAMTADFTTKSKHNNKQTVSIQAASQYARKHMLKTRQWFGPHSPYVEEKETDEYNYKHIFFPSNL